MVPGKHNIDLANVPNPAVLVDETTTPSNVPEQAKNTPAEMILSPEERPVPELFANIVNFRDVGESCKESSPEHKSYVKSGHLFRSGRLDDATTADLDILTNKYGIKTIVDLRSETEGRMSEGLENTFPASAIGALKASDWVAPHQDETHPEYEAIKEAAIRTETEGNRVTYYINFAGTSFRVNSVLWRAPMWLKTKMVWWMSTGQKARTIKTVGETVIQPRGLIGLNYDFVDFCGPEIVQAIRLIADAKYRPLLVHCTQGKDRTGLVIAITLAICSAPDDIIVADYAKTQKGLERMREIMVGEMAKTGLDSTFSDAPPEVMQGTLKYIRDKYKSIESYLERFGFTQTDRNKLRKSLMA